MRALFGWMSVCVPGCVDQKSSLRPFDRPKANISTATQIIYIHMMCAHKSGMVRRVVVMNATAPHRQTPRRWPSRQFVSARADAPLFYLVLLRAAAA